MGRRRLVLALFVAGVGALLGGTTLAWACTPLAQIAVQPQSSGSDRSFEVRGEAFEPGAPVEIRWQSITGPLLARATGPGFVAAATAPANAGDGVHYVVAVGNGENGPHKAVDVVELGRPGVLASSDRGPAADRPSPGSSSPVLGAAMLAGGLVVLFAGAGLVATRRRPAPRATSGT